MLEYFFIALGLWNLFTFALYGIDKLKAKRGSRRISEANLLWCAFVMGGFGAILGQKVFRHKTQKKKFNILLPIALIINVVAITLIIATEKGMI